MTLRARRFGRPRSGRLLAPLLLALAAVVAACGADGGRTTSSAPAPAQAFPRTITDSSGAEVMITAKPRRIISYSPAATEILFAIGAGDRIVAADLFSDYPAETAALPKLEYSSPDPEAALALEPDLLLFATRQRDQLQQFRDLGMTVLLIEAADSVEAVYESIILLGELTDNEQRAEALVRSMRERIEAVTAALSDVEQGPRVFYELSPDLYTVAPATFIGRMLSLLRTDNVARGTESPFPQLSAEAVIEADPEVVLLADAESAGVTAESVAARPGWAGVAAVVNGRIYPIDPDIVNRPGPRIVEGIEAMARALYPDRFE